MAGLGRSRPVAVASPTLDVTASTGVGRTARIATASAAGEEPRAAGRAVCTAIAVGTTGHAAAWAFGAHAVFMGERGRSVASDTLLTRIEGRDLLALPDPIPGGRRQQTIIITSGVRQLPHLVNVTAMIEPTRALPDGETAEAA